MFQDWVVVDDSHFSPVNRGIGAAKTGRQILEVQQLILDGQNRILTVQVKR